MEGKFQAEQMIAHLKILIVINEILFESSNSY